MINWYSGSICLSLKGYSPYSDLVAFFSLLLNIFMLLSFTKFDAEESMNKARSTLIHAPRTYTTLFSQKFSCIGGYRDLSN
jgi:hypothetical protein